jgi:hypothetical protein
MFIFLFKVKNNQIIFYIQHTQKIKAEGGTIPSRAKARCRSLVAKNHQISYSQDQTPSNHLCLSTTATHIPISTTPKISKLVCLM